MAELGKKIIEKLRDKIIAGRIKYLRMSNDVKVGDFAKKIKISRVHLSRVEGARSTPSLKLVFRMAEVLGVDHSFLSAIEIMSLPLEDVKLVYTYEKMRSEKNFELYSLHYGGVLEKDYYLLSIKHLEENK